MLCMLNGCASDESDGDGAASGDALVPYRSMPVGSAPPLPDQSSLRDLSVTVEDAPEVVVPGEPIEFVVAIRNPAARPVELDPCPAYLMSFGESSISIGPVVSLLNCDEADPIPAHGAERFEMRIGVPREFQLSGGGSIYWRLEPSIADASSGFIPVQPTD
ncbi:MAG: hypothetical protein ACLFXM_01155 [Acidimicrobiia bacterium]